jgi:hypothetical protein
LLVGWLFLACCFVRNRLIGWVAFVVVASMLLLLLFVCLSVCLFVCLFVGWLIWLLVRLFDWFVCESFSLDLT